MRLVRLEEIENLKPFDCGDEDLNDFLLSDARLYNVVGAIMRIFIYRHENSACRFLTVDAYKDAVPFYEKNGFKKMVNDEEFPESALTIPLYLDLKQIEL